MPRDAGVAGAQFGGDAGDYRFERDARGRPPGSARRARLQLEPQRANTCWSRAANQRASAPTSKAIRPRAKALALARRFFADDDRRHGCRSARTWSPISCACGAPGSGAEGHGHGLAFGLHRLAFAETDGALFLARCDAELGDPRDWRLRGLPARAWHAAALAWRKG